MVDMDVEGNEIKYFSSKFLVQKYLKYSSEDIKLNKKLKDEEIEELNLAGGDNSDPETLGGMGESVGIDYDKLANMIVEKMSSKSIITEIAEDDTEWDKDKKKKPKRKKKQTKQEEE
jgi:hypothetical protein